MLNQYIGNFKNTGEINNDVPRFLTQWGFPRTAKHCAAVAAKAIELAKIFGSDPFHAERAGYLHDISAVIPNEKLIGFARSHSVDVLKEEIQYPMMIHQKLSVVLAWEVFGVTDGDVLSAIGCHTTLKANSTSLDKVVFLADKIAWDQASSPPYLAEILAAIDKSLDNAVLEYLNYIWERRNQIKAIHPWLVEAREYLVLQTNTG